MPPTITYPVTLTPEPDGHVGAIPLPFDQRAVFGRARPPLVVEIAGYTYRSTVAIMNGRSFVPLRRAHREAAGIRPGERYEVTLTLDTAPREVDIPPDLAAALDAAGLRAVWDALSYTHRREQAEAIESAKRPDTRARRIAAALAKLGGSLA